MVVVVEEEEEDMMVFAASITNYAASFNKVSKRSEKDQIKSWATINDNSGPRLEVYRVFGRTQHYYSRVNFYGVHL